MFFSSLFRFFFGWGGGAGGYVKRIYYFTFIILIILQKGSSDLIYIGGVGGQVGQKNIFIYFNCVLKNI